MKTTHLVLALALALGVVACAEDLTAVNASYATANDGWTKTVAEARRTGDDLAAKIAALPAVKDGDATGKDLRTKLDTAVAAHKQAISDLEQVSVETKGAVEKAQSEQKVVPVQAAIDAGNARWTALQPRLTEATTNATAAYDALKAHLDAEAAKAAAAAADPANQDPVTVTTAGGEATFAMTWTDKNGIDVSASGPSMTRLTKFLGTCETIKVELTGTGADDKAGKARADAAQKALEAQGVAKGRIVKTTGATGDGAVRAKVTSACAMAPASPAPPDTDGDGSAGEAVK